jgi:hypothetical protein
MAAYQRTFVAAAVAMAAVAAAGVLPSSSTLPPLPSPPRAPLNVADASATTAPLPPLPPLNITGNVTVSGISSGADFAASFIVAASDIVSGSGIFAGQPPLCAVTRFEGEPLQSCAAQPATSRGPGCVGLNTTGPAPCAGCPTGATLLYDHCKQPAEPEGPGWVDVSLLLDGVRAAAASGRVPPLSNLQDARVFLYRGTLDTVYLNGSVNKTRDFFAGLVADPTSQLAFEASIPSVHCMPTNDPWLPTDTCGKSNLPGRPPAMCNCGYDGAGAALQHFYEGTLTPPAPGAVSDPANVVVFNQTAYWAVEEAGAAASFAPGLVPAVFSGLASTGYAYIPPSCMAGSPCRLHLAFHGCGMGAPFPTMNTSFVLHTGFNVWADANDLVILYPQGGGYKELNDTQDAPSGQISGGCWDGYGQTGADYAFAAGPQVVTVRNMITALAGAAYAPAAQALPPRPRVILTPSRLADIAAFISNSSDAAAWYASALAQGAYYLTQPPIYVPGKGQTDMLGQAREVLQRVYATGLLWRLTKNATWAARGVAELVNIAQWPDWCIVNDSLVTAELSHAAAVGLDWFADAPAAVFPPSSRAALVAAVTNNALEPFAFAYTSAPPPSWANPNTFLRAPNAYGDVVNAGAILAALAVLGEPGEPRSARAVVLPLALANLRTALASFAPLGDGSFYEGPNYAAYATRVLVPAAWALRSVLGDDAGITLAPGLERLAAFTSASFSPLNPDDADGAPVRFFNWADTDEEPETTVAGLALASFYGDAGTAFSLKDIVNRVPVPANETGNPSMQATAGLLYYTDFGAPADGAAQPLDAVFPARAVAMWRASWTDPGAVFVGAKGGDNGATVHAHQDAGSWVFHAGGVRLVADMGRDSYALFCYFCPPIRWGYYRLGALGHNTLTFDGQTHDWPASAPMIAYSNSSTGSAKATSPPPWAVVDLSPMFASRNVTSARRGFALLAGRTVLLIRDEIDVDPARSSVANLTWAAHANATAEVVQSDGGSAGGLLVNLTRLGVTATIAVVPSATDCPGLAASAPAVNLQPPQLPSTGFVRAQLTSLAPSTCKSITVVVGLAGSLPPLDGLTVNALADWGAEGPVR